MKSNKISRLFPAPVRQRFTEFKNLLSTEFQCFPWQSQPSENETKQKYHAGMLVVLYALLMHVTITTASVALRMLQIPAAAARTVQSWLDIPSAFAVDAWINEELRKRFQNLPGKLRRSFRRKGILIIDFHLQPFYGKESTPGVRKGKPRQSTVLFFGYLTADIWFKGHQFTIAVTMLKPSCSYEAAVKTLMSEVEPFFTPKVILGDGDFSSKEIIRFFLSKGYEFILRFKIYKNRYWLINDQKIRLDHYHIGRSQVFSFFSGKNIWEFDVCCISYRKQDQDRVLVTSLSQSLSPKAIVAVYHHRFAIETGYRDKNLFLIPYKTVDYRIRLFLFAFAVLLWNCWRLWRWQTSQLPQS